MERRSMWPLVIGALVVIAVVVWAAIRHEDVQTARQRQSEGAFGNVMEGVGSKIDQITHETRANAAAADADMQFDAAKSKLGLGDDSAVSPSGVE